MAAFGPWLSSWLDRVEEGLGKHSLVIKNYGARRIEHLDRFDDEDIAAVGLVFGADGMQPLQINLVKEALREQASNVRRLEAKRSAAGVTRTQGWALRSESRPVIPLRIAGRASDRRRAYVYFFVFDDAKTKRCARACLQTHPPMFTS